MLQQLSPEHCLLGCFAQVKSLRMVSMLEGGMTPLLTPAEAQDLGIHMLTYPLSALYAATR